MKGKPDVLKTASGMLYFVTESAGEQKPDDFDTVLVNQRISLVDGTVIADTYKGEPESFTMEEAIGRCLQGERD